MQKNRSKLIQIRQRLQEEGKVIPATFDEMFKEVMKGCPNYLADILYQIIGFDKEMILNNMVIQDTEHRISHILEKRKKSDVIVRIDENIINLEMNPEFYNGLYEKNEAYMRRLGSEMIKITEDYENRKIIQINFDDFTPFDERVVIPFKIMDVERHIVEVENYEKYHINLAKVREKYYNEEERNSLTKLEKELLILVLDDKEKIKEVSKGDVELMEAGKKIEDMSFDINMIGLYDEEEERKKTDYLKNKYKLEQAEENGIEKGANLKSIEIAKKMIAKNIEIETISEVTSLSQEEILKLI